jgi:hypothetical protein
MDVAVIKDSSGRSPRFVLVDDPYREREGDRILLNQFTGKTMRCNKHDIESMRRACRELYEGPLPVRKRQ